MRTFTEEQTLAVVRREGPLLLSAAAGSGKTSVLVERFVRMAMEDGIAPGRILVITFTEKAAGELRSRIREQLLERGERTLAQDAESAWISTFHGFCARVLRSHAVAAGLDPGFAVLDEAAGRELREQAFEQALAGLMDAGEEALDLVAAYTVDRLKTAVFDVFGQLRSAGQVRPRLPEPAPAPAPDLPGLLAARDAAAASLEGLTGATVERAQRALEACRDLGEHPTLAALDAACFKPGNVKALKADPCAEYLAAHAAFAAAVRQEAGARAIALIDDLLGRYGDAYAEAKRERSAVDFDDLELLVAGLFDRLDGLCAAWRGRFDRIMVDEFQDTNPLQVALLDRLDAGHTFRVGDELQSIYGFRHASVEVFRRTRSQLGESGAVAELTRNFRTHESILEAINLANAGLHPSASPLVAGALRGAAGEPLVELLLTDAQNGNWDDAVEKLPGGPSWRWAEARLLAQRIRELIDGGVSAADVVVLVRAATDLACYERALEDVGLATLAAGGRGFWARQQVQDLTSYLAALANPRDEPALLGVLASPLGAALDADGLARLALRARELGGGLWRAAEESDDPAVGAWRERFAAERAAAPRLPLADILTRAIDQSGYEQHVLGLPGGQRRLANVRKLVRLAASYERESGRHVRGFIDRATAELEAEAREADAPVELAGLDAVRLMTIHAAKGLEFPVVAVADLGRDPNTQTPDVLVDGDRVGISVVTLTGKGKTPEYEALREERLQREREESLRVLHVAVTRAQDRLLLSGAANTARWPSSANCAPIGWLFPAFWPGVADELVSTGPVVERGGIRAVLSAPGNGVLRPQSPPEPATDRDIARIPGTIPITAPEVGAPAAVSTLSYSALSHYAQCGYRFYLERVLRLPPQDAPPAPPVAAPSSLDPLTRGSIAHELMELLEEPTPERIAEVAEAHEAELTPADLDDLSTLVANGLASPVMQRVQAATATHVEEPFTLPLVDHPHVPLFTGFIDLRAVEGDGTHLIVDYKTDRLDGADPEELVEKSYGVQRRLYALAALRAGAPRVEVVHLYLERPDRPATAAFEQAQIPELEAYLAEQAAGVLASEFVVAAHPHRELCATCPGRGGMCSWPNETTLQPLAES